ncbi:MAG: UPF0262 family protein [Alphaproteobacteria bacterium]|nr:UPF0262 family protein [Alphaproteobacteria bacterium]
MSDISSIIIDDLELNEHQALLARDRDVAIRDLTRESVFKPLKHPTSGPYALALSVEENRLVFRIQNAVGKDLPMHVLSLKPYRRLVKDYFMIVRSYDEAMREGKPSRIEAIDMGRRGLHNEGAESLHERLSDKIDMDFDTARRLFTLICVLHAQNLTMWR